MKERLKQIADKVPYPVGRLLGKLPMGLRLGRQYSQHARQIEAASTVSRVMQLEMISNLVKFASTETAFYKEALGRSALPLESIDSFADFEQLPITTKADLQQYLLEQRSFPAFNIFVLVLVLVLVV